MASRPTAVKFAEKLLTPTNVHFLAELIAKDLSKAMASGDVLRTSELIELKRYADALAAPKS